MDQKELDQQSQHWEKNFSNKPEMFGLEASEPAKKSLKIFKENNIKTVVELGAGLGRDSIFFSLNNMMGARRTTLLPSTVTCYGSPQFDSRRTTRRGWPLRPN